MPTRPAAAATALKTSCGPAVGAASADEMEFEAEVDDADADPVDAEVSVEAVPVPSIKRVLDLVLLPLTDVLNVESWKLRLVVGNALALEGAV